MDWGGSSMADQAQLAELSVEVCHLYRDELNEDSVVNGLRTAKPIVEAFRETRLGDSLSICMLLDDYHQPLHMTGDEVRELVDIAGSKASLQVDYVVSEAALATTVRALTDRLVPMPYPGAGSEQGDAAVGRYLSSVNGSRLEGREGGTPDWFLPVDAGALEEPTEVKAPGLSGRVHRGQHDVDLMVELWSSETSNRANKYSCAVLAAWWQLVRLGYLRAGEEPRSPDETITLNSLVPFFARRTLSILDPSYIEIEHAVRAILDNFLPSASPEWRGLPTFSPENIAYAFLHGNFVSDE